MAIVTRRYVFHGPWLLDVQRATDPSAALPATNFGIFFDVQYDDAATSQAAVDERMAHFGCIPDTQNTSGLSPQPFLGLIDPGGGVWKLSVNLLGVVATVKVTL